MDFPERQVDDKRQNSQEDNKFNQEVKGYIKLQDGHYYMGLPFKNRDVTLPNNEIQALNRLKGLKARLRSNVKISEYYNIFMNSMLEKKYAERIPEDEICGEDKRIWYIPHHGIYHPRKPEKLRVVFDCSACYNGVSLNSQLLQGPDMSNSLISVLLKFRQEEITVTSDIESMFYQVRVTARDCDCLRFLWWPGGDTNQQPVPYRMLVHPFGATSSSSCAGFALQQTESDNAHEFNPEIINIVRNNFYVDDCLKSLSSTEEAVEVFHSLTDLCGKGGFHLTKWTSNDRNVVDSIPKAERSKTMGPLNLDRDPLPPERALGVQWNVEKDAPGFSTKDIQDAKPTRRSILSITSSTYDPLGIAAPFVLMAQLNVYSC